MMLTYLISLVVSLVASIVFFRSEVDCDWLVRLVVYACCLVPGINTLMAILTVIMVGVVVENAIQQWRADRRYDRR